MEIVLENPDNGCVWVGKVENGRVVVLHGKKGGRLRQTVIPEKAMSHAPEKELLLIARSRKRFGYREVAAGQDASPSGEAPAPGFPALYVSLFDKDSRMLNEVGSVVGAAFGLSKDETRKLIARILGDGLPTEVSAQEENAEALVVFVLILMRLGKARVVDDRPGKVDPYRYLEEHGFLERSGVRELLERFGMLPASEVLESSNVWFI